MNTIQKKAFTFIVFFGFVSLLADITYEGARSISGAYLGMLGASATAVGIIAGFGEFAGYGLRYFSGYLADRTKRYWTITLIGECIGKAIRIPSRDAILSYASQSMGVGLEFGIHEALNKLGAMTEPVLISTEIINPSF